MYKPDMTSAGKVYFLCSVMIVLCILGQALFSALGLGSIRVYQLYIAAMAVFMLIPTARLAAGEQGSFLRVESPGWDALALAVAAAVVAAFMNAHMGNIIYEGLKLTGLSPAAPNIPRTTDWVEFAEYLFYAVIMTGVCEEIVMRGVVLQALMQYGSWRAIVASAALFALLHGRAEAFVQSFALGLMLGFAFLATDSIVTCVVMHMTYNMAVVAASFLPDEWTDALFGGGLWHSAVCVCISAGLITAIMAAMRSLCGGEFTVGKKERIDAAAIILMSAGITTMICVTALNFAQGMSAK